ncbi:hypothetical protein WG66_003560 [Moniliophthora roreri]|nr:hypothetical protein WG66_003560 [Moniliophthora roreri]
MFPLHLYILLFALFTFLALTFVEAGRVCFGCPSAATIFLHQSNPDSEMQLPLVVEDRGIPGVDEELFCEYKKGKDEQRRHFAHIGHSETLKKQDRLCFDKSKITYDYDRSALFGEGNTIIGQESALERPHLPRS